jgi:hypothetical protein
VNSVPLKDANDEVFRPDIFSREEDGEVVVMQAIVPVDPVTGEPLDLATQTTLVALATAVTTLNEAAAAIKLAVEALNNKTTTINTGQIGGTVALDGPTLAALESINASANLAQPLTDNQLRDTPVPVSMTGAATENTLAGLLTNQQLRASPLPIDLAISLLHALEMISEGPQIDPGTGRLRVVLDANGGAQTLGTVSNVTSVATLNTLTTLSQIAGVPANSVVYDLMDMCWAQSILSRVS